MLTVHLANSKVERFEDADEALTSPDRQWLLVKKDGEVLAMFAHHLVTAVYLPASYAEAPAQSK